MSYENPPVPDEVNVSRENPVLEFLRLVAALAVIVALAAAFLFFAGGYLARFIPFETELAMTGEGALSAFSTESADPAIESYLQELVDDLGTHMDLPPGMRIDVAYSGMDVPNAFATLGGHVIVTTGLYTRMPSENALSMVLAHEIAHIRERDPISALGGVAMVQLALALLGADAASLSPHVAHLVQLGYSRQVEWRADTLAMEAVRRKYGHLGGTAATFEVLADYRDRKGARVPSLLSTHPADAERIARLRGAASTGNAPLQPLRLPERD
jgi:predicted Zn-dependent protease